MFILVLITAARIGTLLARSADILRATAHSAKVAVSMDTQWKIAGSVANTLISITAVTIRSNALAKERWFLTELLARR